MKLPGKAWLEFHVLERDDVPYLQQTPTFRPKGLPGRLYWYAVLRFRSFVFEGMARGLVRGEGRGPGPRSPGDQSTRSSRTRPRLRGAGGASAGWRAGR